MMTDNSRPSTPKLGCFLKTKNLYSLKVKGCQGLTNHPKPFGTNCQENISLQVAFQKSTACLLHE